MTRLLHQFLEESARRLPDKVCLVYRGVRLTYSEVEAKANRLARFLLERGVERGDRVAVYLNNSPEAVIGIFAALKAGAAFVPINPTAKRAKLRYLLENSRPAAILTHGSKLEETLAAAGSELLTVVVVDAPAAREGVTPFDEVVGRGSAGPPQTATIDLDLAAIIYTSSSTGPSKGVMLSHLNMVAAAESITSYLGSREHDVVLDLLPISFDYGLYQVLNAFRVGARVVLDMPFAFMNRALDLVEAERVTGLPGVPTLFAMLLGMKDLRRRDLSSIRCLTNTAAPLPIPHVRRLRELFPRAKLFSMYGLTECKRVSFLEPEEIDRRPDSVGKAIPNEEVFIVDEAGVPVRPGEVGELVVRGSNVMLGYWGMPEETAACLAPGRYPGERVLRTGDLFRADAEGFLYFVGRKDDIIKCRGEKVSPREIESVLHELEGVREAVVVGVPDPLLGEAVKAYVALDEGSALSAERVLNHCAANLETVFVPKYVEIVDTLPRTPTGKVDARGLRGRAAAVPDGAASGRGGEQ